jgi:hypothetical protein
VITCRAFQRAVRRCRPKLRSSFGNSSETRLEVYPCTVKAPYRSGGIKFVESIKAYQTNSGFAKSAEFSLEFRCVAKEISTKTTGRLCGVLYGANAIHRHFTLHFYRPQATRIAFRPFRRHHSRFSVIRLT